MRCLRELVRPVRMLATVLVAAMLGVLAYTDRQTMAFMGAFLSKPGISPDIVYFTSKVLSLAFLLPGCAIVVAIVNVWGGVERKRASKALLYASLIQIVTTEGLKSLFGRERPFKGSGMGLFHGPTLDFRSFPSGHATWTFMSAVILSAYYPRFRIGFYLLAGLVSLSRYGVGSHFLSDILAGAGLGLVLGAVFVALYPPQGQEGATPSAAPLQRFAGPEPVAVVGVSRRNKLKVGRLLFDALRRAGREVVPINPAADEIDGVRCFPNLHAVGQSISAVFVAVPAEPALKVVEECAELGIRNVWLIGGAAKAHVRRLCREKGIPAIYGSCPIQWVAPHSFHWLHRKLSDWLRLKPDVTE